MEREKSRTPILHGDLHASKYETNIGWKYGSIVNGVEYVWGADEVNKRMEQFNQYNSHSLPNYIVLVSKVHDKNRPVVIILDLLGNTISVAIEGQASFSQIMRTLISDEVEELVGDVGKNVAINIMPQYLRTYTGKNVPYTWTNGILTYTVLDDEVGLIRTIHVDDSGKRRILSLETTEEASVDVDNGVIMMIRHIKDRYHTVIYELDNETGSMMSASRLNTDTSQRSVDANTYTSWKRGTNTYMVYDLKDYSKYLNYAEQRPDYLIDRVAANNMRARMHEEMKEELNMSKVQVERSHRYDEPSPPKRSSPVRRERYGPPHYGPIPDESSPEEPKLVRRGAQGTQYSGLFD